MSNSFPAVELIKGQRLAELTGCENTRSTACLQISICVQTLTLLRCPRPGCGGAAVKPSHETAG